MDADERAKLLTNGLSALRTHQIITEAPRLRQAAEVATGRKFQLTEKSHALRSFLNSDMDGLSDEHEELLVDFLFRTRLGRALLHPDPDTTHPYEGVLNPLLEGTKAAPHGANFEGFAFVYHGSYKWPRMVAVHLVKVTADEGGLLSVTDYIRDQVSASTPIDRNSIGCMTFVGDKAYILTSGKENRIGYSLFIGDPQIDSDKKVKDARGTAKPRLIEIVGDLFGTNDNHQNFARKALIRPASGELDELLASTGIFSSRDIKTGKCSPTHADGFRRLRRLATDGKHNMLPDPVATMRY